MKDSKARIATFGLIAVAGLALCALSGCGGNTPAPRVTPPPQTRPITAPPLAPPPPLSADWRDFPLTPGIWTYQPDQRGSVAKFGQAGQNAVFLIRCDRGDSGNRVILSRASMTPGDATMHFLTSGGPGSFTARTPNTDANTAGAQPLPYAMVALSANEPYLDKIVHTQARFMVRMEGVAPLVLPIWAEAVRAVEDCRK